VFTGDTLFTAGCGRFFEGDGAQMHAALTYLGTLPDSTVVYSGHEYTAGNLSFGRHIDPTNKAFDKLQAILDKGTITQGAGTIGDEKEWNVFMRLGSDAVRFVSLSFKVCGTPGSPTTFVEPRQVARQKVPSWMT
jgi:hydroxyacylglutathione hydrolase